MSRCIYPLIIILLLTSQQALSAAPKPVPAKGTAQATSQARSNTTVKPKRPTPPAKAPPQVRPARTPGAPGHTITITRSSVSRDRRTNTVSTSTYTSTRVKTPARPK